MRFFTYSVLLHFCSHGTWIRRQVLIIIKKKKILFLPCWIVRAWTEESDWSKNRVEHLDFTSVWKSLKTNFSVCVYPLGRPGHYRHPEVPGTRPTSGLGRSYRLCRTTGPWLHGCTSSRDIPASKVCFHSDCAVYFLFGGGGKNCTLWATRTVRLAWSTEISPSKQLIQATQRGWWRGKHHGHLVTTAKCHQDTV